ncbi:MAG: hypothetical protein HKN44_07810 [Ilumatobacter sp.]|nr:hypothetical protein [Ilumatobacter sp.]
MSTDRSDRRDDVRVAALGGVFAAVIGFGGMAIVGTASPVEARRLLDGVLPTVRFAASAYIAGGASVLALMLTLLTFSISHELEFRPSHYHRIRDIAVMTTVVIGGSVMLLMFLSFPLGEADVNRSWYQWVYYAVLLGGAVIGGVFISIVLMLYYAIRGLIGVGQDPSSSALIDSADAEAGVEAEAEALTEDDRDAEGEFVNS